LQLKDQLFVPPLDKVHDLGIILDSRLNMEAHVAVVLAGRDCPVTAGICKDVM